MNVSYYYHHLHNIDWEIAPQLQRLMGLNKLRPQSKKAKTQKITKLTHLHSILELFHIRISIGCMDFIIIHCFLESCVGNNLDLVYTCSRSTCKINTQLRWNPFWIGRKKSSRKMQFEWRQNILIRLRSALFSSFLPFIWYGWLWPYIVHDLSLYFDIKISDYLYRGIDFHLQKKKRFSRVTFSSLDFQVLAKHSTNGAHKRKKL